MTEAKEEFELCEDLAKKFMKGGEEAYDFAEEYEEAVSNLAVWFRDAREDARKQLLEQQKEPGTPAKSDRTIPDTSAALLFREDGEGLLGVTVILPENTKMEDSASMPVQAALKTLELLKSSQA